MSHSIFQDDLFILSLVVNNSFKRNNNVPSYREESVKIAEIKDYFENPIGAVCRSHLIDVCRIM